MIFQTLVKQNLKILMRMVLFVLVLGLLALLGANSAYLISVTGLEALSGHVYQNYADASLQNFRWAYWGDAYPTLLSIKKKYDPTNFFRYQQSIS